MPEFSYFWFFLGFGAGVVSLIVVCILDIAQQYNRIEDGIRRSK